MLITNKFKTLDLIQQKKLNIIILLKWQKDLLSKLVHLSTRLKKIKDHYLLVYNLKHFLIHILDKVKRLKILKHLQITSRYILEID